MTPDTFRALALTNPINAAILDRLPALGLEQAYLVAGCLYQAVWNARDGRAPGWGVKDYDLFYYDPDTRWEAEDAVIRRATGLFADLGVEVEVRNQARVHLWYPQRFGKVIAPLNSSRDSIAGFLVRCTCVGLSAAGEVVAPYGLEELAAGTLSPNLRTNNPAQYRIKIDSYRARWPWLVEGP
ncbi:hypothetical protein CHU95_04205 [Niveispirillum lacus]|uniref:Nucleotidyltransferase family protein n=1 Tax=Niveispirillum lacus TaxID=1981099 RepID=A0A255Z727_9PROT|nr:nucleotidyltransferase family protein [Niveispirillum lacus]OYQ36440.1 hypothetical protein CHU95_04205 [Niveispirillum lacus]